MRIFHIIPQFKNGGVETAALSSLESMNEHNDFRLISIEPTKTASLPKKAVSLNSTIYNPLLYIRFFKLILEEKPDVLIFSLWKSSLLGIVIWPFVKLLRKKITTVVIIHSARYAHFVDKIITKTAVRLFHRVFFDSESSKQFTFANSKVSGEVISFILRRPNAKKFSFKPNNLRFIFVGRINTIKNVDLTIDFIKELDGLGLNVTYDIYGPDEGMVSICQDKINKYNLGKKVCFKGSLENERVPEILKNYDFYIQFSKVEGMAMSVVEAMQVGLIPCVTNVGQIDHYARHLHNAIIFDVNKLHDPNYLNQMGKVLKAIISDAVQFKLLSKNAADSFAGELIYAEDLERKILGLK